MQILDQIHLLPFCANTLVQSSEPGIKIYVVDFVNH